MIPVQDPVTGAVRAGPASAREVLEWVRKRGAQSRGFERDARAAWERLEGDVRRALDQAWPPMTPVQRHNNRELLRLGFMEKLMAGSPVEEAEREMLAVVVRAAKDWKTR